MNYVEDTACLLLDKHKSISGLKLNETKDVAICTLSTKGVETGAVDVPYFLMCSFCEGGCEFLLSDTKQTWKGSLTADEVDTHAFELNQTKDEYLKQLKEAFENKNNISLKVHKSDTEIPCISWQKRLENETAFILGKVFMTKTKITNAEFLSQVFKFTNKLRNEMNNVENDQCEIIKQNERLQSELKQCAEDKKKMEFTLLKKFVEVLNDKKKKIRDLEERLSSTEIHPETVVNDPAPMTSEVLNESKKSSTKTKKRIADMLDDSENLGSYSNTPVVKAKKFQPIQIPVINYGSGDSTTDCEDTLPLPSDMIDDM